MQGDIKYSDGRCELTMAGLRRLVAESQEVPDHARIQILSVGTYDDPDVHKPVPVELRWRATWVEGEDTDPFIGAYRARTEAAKREQARLAEYGLY